jgi:hypothetical protein
MKQYAFLLMGGQYDTRLHQAQFGTAESVTYLRTVNTFEEAYATLAELVEKGVGAVELCGAFGQEQAKKMAELTGHKVAIGYVVHDPDMDALNRAFFEGF